MVNADLILFGKPYLLRDEAAWHVHEEKLNAEYGTGCHHGEPVSFPCLVLTNQGDDEEQAHYLHDFVTVEDACLLVETVESAALAERRSLGRRALAVLRGAVEIARE